MAKVLGKINQKEEIYFKNGSYYDAYSTFIDIIKKTKKELIVIDSYADKTILDLIRNTNCKVILITRNSERLSESDISKYNLEYNNLEVIRNNEFHDRFFILDRDTLYYIGTSINYAGNSSFVFAEMVNEDEKKKIILDVEKQLLTNERKGF